MANTRGVLGWLLAASTAFAGAVCACEVAAHGGTDAAHAHHASTGDADHCVQVDDCPDCDLTVSGTDRQIGPMPPPTAAPDDALAVDAIVQVAPPRHRLRHHHPPPRMAPRAADTAVHRFDILLN